MAFLLEPLHRVPEPLRHLAALEPIPRPVTLHTRYAPPGVWRHLFTLGTQQEWTLTGARLGATVGTRDRIGGELGSLEGQGRCG